MLVLIILPLKTEESEKNTQRSTYFSIASQWAVKLKEEENKLFTHEVDPHLQYKAALV